jgi:acetylglutamate kinase
MLESAGDSGIIPVIAPIGVGPNGETFNINADTVAGAIAGRGEGARLLMLTDVSGVLDKQKNLIAELTVSDAPADRRRHHLRRHDPEGRDLRARGRARRRRAPSS